MKVVHVLLLFCLIAGCNSQEDSAKKIRVIFDTDTNNELDDQHAMAYLLFNAEAFDIAGVTVNATSGGGNIDEQFKEASRVSILCGYEFLDQFKGANGNFDSIRLQIDSASFDGSEAVTFMMEEAAKSKGEKLTIIAVGKLTTVALLLQKFPQVIDKIKIVWLGSNYPDPGEYNLDNDTASVNFVIKTDVELEIVTVRYGNSDGSDVVRVTKDEINKKMAGNGPVGTSPVTGRHGGQFTNFGDYSVSLFEHIKLTGNPPSRALYDMVAVAIVKNPTWGSSQVTPRPLLINNRWVEGAAKGTVKVWGNFKKEEILNDFFNSMDHPKLAKSNK